MATLTKLLAVVALLGNGAIAAAQVPANSENLLVSPPGGFEIGFQSSRDTGSLSEWVPAGEAVENWTQMLTVQIYRGLAADAPVFLQAVGKRYMDACPGTTAKGVFTGHVNGYVVSMLLLRCPHNPGTGKPETTAFRVIRGRDALYAVQRAWRSVPTDQAVDEVMHALSRVTVCDTRGSDHPCPTFDSLVPPK